MDLMSKHLTIRKFDSYAGVAKLVEASIETILSDTRSYDRDQVVDLLGMVIRAQAEEIEQLWVRLDQRDGIVRAKHSDV